MQPASLTHICKGACTQRGGGKGKNSTQGMKGGEPQSHKIDKRLTQRGTRSVHTDTHSRTDTHMARWLTNIDTGMGCCNSKIHYSISCAGNYSKHQAQPRAASMTWDMEGMRQATNDLREAFSLVLLLLGQ